MTILGPDVLSKRFLCLRVTCHTRTLPLFTTSEQQALGNDSATVKITRILRLVKFYKYRNYKLQCNVPRISWNSLMNCLRPRYNGIVTTVNYFTYRRNTRTLMTCVSLCSGNKIAWNYWKIGSIGIINSCGWILIVHTFKSKIILYKETGL